MDTRTRNSLAKTVGYVVLALESLPKAEGTKTVYALLQSCKLALTNSLELETTPRAIATAQHSSVSLPVVLDIAIPQTDKSGWIMPNGQVLDKPTRRYCTRTAQGAWAIWTSGQTAYIVTLGQDLAANCMAKGTLNPNSGVYSLVYAKDTQGKTAMRVNLLPESRIAQDMSS